MFFHCRRCGLESSVLVPFRRITFYGQRFIDVRSIDACTCRRHCGVFWKLVFYTHTIVHYIFFCSVVFTRYFPYIVSGWVCTGSTAKPPGRLRHSKSEIARHNPRLSKKEHDMLPRLTSLRSGKIDYNLSLELTASLVRISFCSARMDYHTDAGGRRDVHGKILSTKCPKICIQKKRGCVSNKRTVNVTSHCQRNDPSITRPSKNWFPVPVRRSSDSDWRPFSHCRGLVSQKGGGKRRSKTERLVYLHCNR